jgi:hypothetical protein
MRCAPAAPAASRNKPISFGIGAERDTMENKMRAFIRRFLLHYGIYRRYPLSRFPALRNAWRAAQP